MVRRAFELGEIDILALAQIRERILRSHRTALDALVSYYDALAALEAMTGGEVRGDEDSSR